MRAFFGIVFNDETKDKLYEIEQTVQGIASKGRFVARDNFHITLKFLGEIDTKQVDDYSDLLDAAVSGFNPFILKTEGLGSFTKGNRIIPWVGLSTNKTLIAMNKNLQEMLFRNYGMRYENYTPHITLGRQVELIKVLNTVEIPSFDIEVNRIALFESKNVNNKLIYEEKAIITLH